MGVPVQPAQRVGDKMPAGGEVAAAGGFGATKALLASVAIGVLVAGGVTAALVFGLGGDEDTTLPPVGTAAPQLSNSTLSSSAPSETTTEGTSGSSSDPGTDGGDRSPGPTISTPNPPSANPGTGNTPSTTTYRTSTTT